MKRATTGYFPWDKMRKDGRTNLQYAIDLYKRGIGEEEIAEELSRNEKTKLTTKAIRSKLGRVGAYMPRRKRIPAQGHVTLPDDAPNLNFLMRENERLRESERRTREWVDSITASLCSIAQAIPPINPIPEAGRPPKTHHRPHVAVAVNSDMQIGTYVNPRDVCGLGGMDFDTFKAEVVKWVDTIILLTDLHRNNYPIDILDIPFLGDNIEGEQIFPSQAHFIDLPATEQVLEGVHVIAWALRTLAQEGRFKKIRTRWVAGNHGRPGLKGMGHPGTNWDYIFANYVATLCSNIPQIEFYIADRASSFMAYHIPECPDFQWLIAHGDQIKGSMSLPYYGLDRAKARWIELTGILLDYILIGHHHRDAQISGIRGKTYVNGSWVSGTDLTINKMVTSGDAKQLMLIVHPEMGVVASHDIFLSRVPDMEANENGIYTPCREVLRPFAEVTR